jgi:hypothetical protein
MVEGRPAVERMATGFLAEVCHRGYGHGLVLRVSRGTCGARVYGGFYRDHFDGQFR